MVTNNSCDQSPVQYKLQTGGASGTLNNVTPSATSGVPVISQGASSQPTYGTLAIAGGGTNATSFAHNNGIVAYNGTSLLNYTGPQLSSAGRMTNTTQPVFLAYYNANSASITGDGTQVTAVFNTAEINVGSSYATGTGIFTAPVTGTYFFQTHITYEISGAGTNTGTFVYFSYNNGSFLYAAANSTAITTVTTVHTPIEGALIIHMSANDTMRIRLEVDGNASKNVLVQGQSLNGHTRFSGYLIC